MDDLISRQAAIGLIHTLYPSAPIMRVNRERWKEKYKSYIECEKALEQLPSVQPERKKGKWINGACNQCGSHAPYWAMATTYYRSNFCPNCGAKMEVEE